MFHRERAAAPPRRRRPTPPSRRPCRSFSMLDPPRHTQLRQAMIGPFRPRAVAPARRRPCAASPGAQLDALARRDELRRAPRLRVAGGRAGRGAAARVPGRGRRALVTLVNRSCTASPTSPASAPTGMAAHASSTTTSPSFVAERAPVPRPPTTTATARPDRRPAATTPAPHGPLDDAEVATSSSRCSSAAPRRCRRSSPAAPTSSGGTPSSAPRWSADPSWRRRAFEEMLRYQLPLQFVGRTLLVDTEVAGVPMRAGQRVVLAADLRRTATSASSTIPSASTSDRAHGPPPRVRPRRARVHRCARRAARGCGAAAGAAARASPTTRSTASGARTRGVGVPRGVGPDAGHARGRRPTGVR